MSSEKKILCKAPATEVTISRQTLLTPHAEGKRLRVLPVSILLKEILNSILELLNRLTQAISTIQRPRYEYTKRRCIPGCSTFREGKDPMAWHFAYLWRLITYVCKQRD